GRIGGSIQFFFYDVIKITVLLCFLIFIISYIQSYFPPERSRKIMGRFHGISANIIAALLGTVTPFCSCSSIPIFMGFTGAGLPLGVTFSFLISSPMVDLGSFVLLISVFGGKVAITYVAVGLFIAVVGGTIIEKLHMENYVEDFIKAASSTDIQAAKITKKERASSALDRVLFTLKK
ncbi:MAG: permease, partial [Clostridia bacterium]